MVVKTADERAIMNVWAHNLLVVPLRLGWDFWGVKVRCRNELGLSHAICVCVCVSASEFLFEWL